MDTSHLRETALMAGKLSEAGDPGECITIENLTKVYGDLKAVDDLSLAIPAGRLFGILGANGAGKSTIINCLAGLIDPTAGSMRFFGDEFTGDSCELKRRLGVMPEGLALFDQLYAYEFLSFSAQMFGLDRLTTRQRVEELLEALDLTSFHKVPLAQYSSGMRKKVALAAAMIHRPEVLILDEPFVSIDPATTAMLKAWLRRFVAHGHTVIMTSHVLETVERLCDEVAIIHGGRLSWRGYIGRLVRGEAIEYGAESFETLEALFLHITGDQRGQLDWLQGMS